jgi:hypothetical protein
LDGASAGFSTSAHDLRRQAIERIAVARPQDHDRLFSASKKLRVSEWVEADSVRLAHAACHASWLNRVEAQFTAPQDVALDGTAHPAHIEQARMICSYVAW